MPAARTPILITFPQPAPIWSTNQRTHWSKRARLTKTWRETAAWAAISNRETRNLKGRWEVEIVLPFPTRRRRDPSNFISTVLKACVDGLVDAGVWDDDTPQHVRIVEPLIILSTHPQPDIEIHLNPIPPPRNTQ